MMMLGIHFDEDPLIPEARRILEDPAIPTQIRRMDSLYATLAPKRHRVMGPDARNLFIAVARARGSLNGPDAGAPDDAETLRQRLSIIFPERIRAAGAEATRRFVSEVERRTWDAGFSDPGAVAIVGILSLCAGIDPASNAGGRRRGAFARYHWRPGSSDGRSGQRGAAGCDRR
jgi:hypothetical protein